MVNLNGKKRKELLYSEEKKDNYLESNCGISVHIVTATKTIILPKKKPQNRCYF